MPYLVVATAGHIDHGKSALVRALTGIDPDRLKEEKERGITIELGFAHATLGDTTVAFVDVPGHERFVKTMLAGVGGVDAVVLIVAADESVMPQTREHFDICRLLHVSRGLTVLTKADLVDQPMLDLVTLEVGELVAGSFLEGAPVVAVSAKTGAGLDTLRSALVALSTDFRTKDKHEDHEDHEEVSSKRLDSLRVLRDLRVQDSSCVRLPIDRVFSMTGFGTVLTGTLQSGAIRVDEELLLLPGARTVRVRGLHMHGRAQTEVGARHRVAVNVAGVDVAEVARGQTLAAPGMLSVTRRLDAEVDVLPSAHALRHGERVRFHNGTADAFGRLVLGADVREIAPGARALLRVRLESPVAVTRGDRFILRSASHAMTVAGGRILDPDPASKAPRSVNAQARLQALAASAVDDVSAFAAMVTDRGAKGLAVAELISRGGVVREHVEETAARLEREHEIVRAGDRLVARSIVDTLSTRLLATVGEVHKRDPLSEGLSREEARERLFARADPAVFDLVLSRLRDAGTLIVRDRLALSTHTAGLSSDERVAQSTLARAYREAGLTPPDPSAVAAGLDPALALRMLELMVRQKALLRLGGLIFHPDVLAGLKADVRGLKQSPDAHATVDVATFKQRYGVSRKFAIPLLEWLDRERVTRRVGDVRVVL